MSPIHIGQVRETQKPCAWLAVCKKIEKEYKQTASETSFLEMARLQNHSFAEDLSFAIFFLYIYLICNNTEFQTLAHTSITLPELLAGPSAATLRCPVRPQPWFVCGSVSVAWFGAASAFSSTSKVQNIWTNLKGGLEMINSYFLAGFICQFGSWPVRLLGKWPAVHSLWLVIHPKLLP